MKSENAEKTNINHRETRRIAIVIILSAVACFLTYYFQGILKTQIVFTHFFYIPIILSALWWKKKGLITGIFLAAVLLLSNIISEKGNLFINDFLRASFFIIIGFITAWLSGQIEASQEKLRESENKFRSVAETVTDWIWEVDGNGKYVYSNPVVKDLLGYEIGEVLGKTPFDFMTKEEAEKIGQAFKEIVGKREKFYNMENINRHKNGQPVVLETSGAPILDEKGQLKGYRGIDRDITERKKVEDLLRISEKRLSFSIESGDIGLWELDLVNHTAWRSLRHDQIFGYETLLPEWTYEMFLEHVVPEDRLEVGRKFGEALAKSIEWDFECRIKRKNGAIRWIWAKGNPELNERNEPVRMFGVVQDITERRKAEEKVRLSAEEWSKTFDSISDLIFILDKEHTITKVNKAFAEALKSRPEDLIGKKCYELLHKSNMPWPGCPFEAAKNDKKPHLVEVNDKNIGIPLLVSISPIFDNTGEVTGAVHIAKDISRMKEDEKRLHEVQSQLFQTSKLATLGEMSTGLAHEMNQPLNGIVLTAKNLRKLMDGDLLTNEEITDGLKDIDNSITRISKIIQHIRIFARQDTFKFEEVNIKEVIENAMNLLGEQLRLHEIEVIKEYADDLPRIIGEPYQLEQVIINLLTNARDAIDEKSKKNPTDYSGKITFKTEKTKNEICIVVSDNGIGMTGEVREKMFHPFFTTKEAGKSTGLGMSISHGIIETHKGRIQAESKDGEGTTIKVFLPIKMTIEN